jgi:hypothetical protein
VRYPKTARQLEPASSLIVHREVINFAVACFSDLLEGTPHPSVAGICWMN